MYATEMELQPSTLLRQKGLKATASRIAILAIFGERCAPVTAEEVFLLLKRQKVNQVTVYRTFETFLRKKLIKRVDLRKDAVCYELADDHHHHIVCTSCGILEEFVLCNIDKVSREVLKKSRKFRNIQEHSLEFFGICQSCSLRK